ncbi:type II toxin-antitoxin system YhaV family toxin [Cyanobacterium aponinum AL20118]|uniref:Type II toxin-antitoxin system YhaV family toxin n=1 Tax=Cyanobacterium aponinum AL20115 TaxID=3090662 RepID=A0AAF0ZAE5_9CHRO|nr:type II toxin-antitoxin system YhaV family toxin [Cyanobacterium aponinum]WPF87900.1 type II toxin-antitoxin system YhaV family toxin [Cyanobacterium aponinum AL20115]
MKLIKINGYLIYFHPLFYQQWLELVNRVKYLKQKSAPENFVTHPDVKLLKALDQGFPRKSRFIYGKDNHLQSSLHSCSYL